MADLGYQQKCLSCRHLMYTAQMRQPDAGYIKLGELRCSAAMAYPEYETLAALRGGCGLYEVANGLEGS